MFNQSSKWEPRGGECATGNLVPHGCTYHLDRFRVDVLGDDVVLGNNVLHQLVQCLSLDIFPFEVGERVHTEVEQNTTLLQLLDEQLLAIRLGSLLDGG